MTLESRAELEAYIEKARAAERGEPAGGDEGAAYFAAAFAAGRDLH